MASGGWMEMAHWKPHQYVTIDQIVPEEDYTDDRRHFTHPLPDYDRGTSTKKLSLSILIITSILSAIAIVGSVVMLYTSLKNGTPVWNASSAEGSTLRIGTAFVAHTGFTAKGLTLLFTIIIMIATENLGYIHSVCLRWALAQERRLKRNSNLRLFTSSKASITNGVFANIVWAFFFILCYGGAATCFYEEIIVVLGDDSDTLEEVTVVYLDAVSLGATGLAGLMLCIISGVGWLAGERSGRIKTWNSHPLNTALACRNERLIHRFQEHNDRFHIQFIPGQPYPMERNQFAAKELMPGVKWVTVSFLVIFLIISLLTSIILALVLIIRLRNPDSPFYWSFSSTPTINETGITDTGYTYTLIFTTIRNLPIWLQPWLPLLWSCIWQSISTLTFHIAELLVQVRRDETCWRKATSISGAKLEQNALIGALSNNGSRAVFCLKPLGQWVFGLGVFVIGFNPLPLIVLAIVLFILLLVTWLAARWHPSGPQFATYGHLQTLVDLVDDWGQGAAPEARLWWGDKGSLGFGPDGVEVRRMGTASHRLQVGRIQMEAYYAVI